MKSRLRPLVDILQQQRQAPQPDQITSQISKFSETMQNVWGNLRSGQRLIGRIELEYPIDPHSLTYGLADISIAHPVGRADVIVGVVRGENSSCQGLNFVALLSDAARFFKKF